MNELYTVSIKNGVIGIVLIENAIPEQIHEIDTNREKKQLPRFAKIEQNKGYSYRNPTIDEDLKRNITNMNLSDGDYFMTMEYEYYRYGWASGSNWYGGNIVKKIVSSNEIISMLDRLSEDAYFNNNASVLTEEIKEIELREGEDFFKKHQFGFYTDEWCVTIYKTESNDFVIQIDYDSEGSNSKYFFAKKETFQSVFEYAIKWIK